MQTEKSTHKTLGNVGELTFTVIASGVELAKGVRFGDMRVEFTRNGEELELRHGYVFGGKGKEGVGGWRKTL